MYNAEKSNFDHIVERQRMLPGKAGGAGAKMQPVRVQDRDIARSYLLPVCRMYGAGQNRR